MNKKEVLEILEQMNEYIQNASPNELYKKFEVCLMENNHCPFCGPDGVCGKEWCPYTKEKK